MKYLLDTHTILWFLNGDPKLSKTARAEIEKPLHSKLISIASVWEIAIKLSLNKLKLSISLHDLIDSFEQNGFELLPITYEHTIIVSSLEWVHRDPFDRILIAQSKSEKLTIITKDQHIKSYKIKTLW
jgi:PIN domain nuclease of toxin-antitoxin system